MSEILIEQVLFFRDGSLDFEQAAQSGGYQSGWSSEIKNILQAFGELPNTSAFPPIVFAQPLNKRHVLIVQVERLKDSSNTGYYVLIVPRRAYADYLGDPFAVAEKCKPDWQAQGELPPLHLPKEALPTRTVAQVQKVLKRVKYAALQEDVPGEEQITAEQDPAAHSEGPALLGGVQVLVDGGRLVFERSNPDPSLVKAIWTLLPRTTRAELWPTTFAFNNAIPFDVMVVSHYSAEDYSGYTTEDQAADYPEGRYELALQFAAEAGDQEGLDTLFHRRSSKETLRMAVFLLIFMVVVVGGSYLLAPSRRPSPQEIRDEQASPQEIRDEQAKIVSGMIGIRQPFHSITYWNAARDKLNQLEKQMP